MNNYRYEIKFSLDEIAYSEAMRWLQVNTHATKKYDDRYVNSLYFDNPGYSAVRDNITGLSDRSKYRLRWYNSTHSPNDVISPSFEQKIRKGRLGRKEITPLTNLNENFVSLPLHQIESDIRLELQKTNVLFDDYYTSVLAVKYLREYFEDNEGLRITLDSKIQFLYVDGMTWLTDDILVKVDRSSMQHSLEVRCPYLDIELVDYAASIPAKLKMKGFETKYILKKTLKDVVPDFVLSKKKSGFNAPVGSWLDIDGSDEFRIFNKYVYNRKVKI